MKYTARVNLATFVSLSTDANKRTKASKTEKSVYSKFPLEDQNVDIIKGKSSCLMVNIYCTILLSGWLTIVVCTGMY